MERKRKPQILPKFNFNNSLSIREKYELDDIKGQGSIVLSVLQYTPMPTDSREVGDVVGAHPEFKTSITVKTSGGMEPEYRVTNYWLSFFRKIGLITYEDESEQRNFEIRAKGKITSYSKRRTNRS